MSAGTYIWQGLKPTLKMVMTIACGYTITKKGLFPPAASKGLSQVAMNIGLPCLLFSSMVPSFNDSNIQNFGPLSLISILFIFIGTGMFAIMREIFYVPGDFQWGFLMLGAMSNWGNLPTAIIQSVGTEAPFNPATDQQLGIAYTAVFILIMNVMFYGVGTYRICGWDMRPNRPTIPKTFAGRMARRQRQLHSLLKWFSKKKHHLHVHPPGPPLSHETVNQIEEGATSGVGVDSATQTEDRPVVRKVGSRTGGPSFPSIERIPSSHADVESLAWEDNDIKAPRMRARSASSASRGAAALAAGSATKQRHDDIHEEDEEIQVNPEQDVEKDPRSELQSDSKEAKEAGNTPVDAEAASHHSTRVSIWRSIWNAITPMLTPATLGVIVSVPISLISPLKALFVSVDGWTGTQIPNAPDGKPPLAFFYDFTAFVGGMTIPGGLIILGASFARIKISRSRLREMPIGALIASTVGKLLIAPVIGILVVVAFRDGTTLFPDDEKMLGFCAFLLSGTPSAINQLVATQIFAREGQSIDTLSTFLLAQYSLLLLQSAALTAISLWLAS